VHELIQVKLHVCDIRRSESDAVENSNHLGYEVSKDRNASVFRQLKFSMGYLKKQ